MINNIDVKIASYVARYMLDHDRLSLERLKEEFYLDDLKIRKVFIRLYYQNKVFGIIDSSSSNQSFLNFQPKNAKKKIEIEELIDWDIKEFDLNSLKEFSHEIDNTDSYIGDNSLPYSKDFENLDSESKMKYSSVKETHKKDMITFSVNSYIEGYANAIKLFLQNGSDKDITNIKIRINLSDDIKFFDIKPEYPVNLKQKQVWVIIDKIEAKQTKKAILFLDQGRIGQPLEISGYVQYHSELGFIRFFRLDSISMDTSLPSVSPGKIAPNLIKEFMKNKTMSKKISAMGYQKYQDWNDMEKIIKSMEKITKKLNFTLISRIVKKEKKIRMSFFYGISRIPNGESYGILIVPQIKNNVFSFYVCCKYPIIVSNIIRALCYNLQELLRNKNILKTDENLILMNCIKCGSVLEIFPPKGELIACKACQSLQKPW